MKKQLLLKNMKIITPLLALLIITSLTTSPALVTAQTTTTDTQEKTMHFMENILPIDISKYTITLQGEYVNDLTTRQNHSRYNTNVLYQLSSADNELTVNFIVENDKIVACYVYTMTGEVISNTPHLNPLDAVKDFLEKYQPYSKMDSNNLIAMLDDVDVSKNSTATAEGVKLYTYNTVISGVAQTVFDWIYTVDDVDYTWLVLVFDAKGNFVSMTDTRILYTVGDTSINVSEEQAIEIALEKLQSYSYEMADGSVIKDFKVSDVAAMLYTLPVDYVEYELRPYWDVRLFFEDVYPGNVFGITVFLWANTGEIISYSNMASGGINYPDNTNSTDSTTAPVPNSNTLIIGITIAVIAVIVVTTGILIAKKRTK